MRTPCSTASLLCMLLASLLLIQVLAAVPQASNSRSSRPGIDARDAISWLKAHRTADAARPIFEARLPTGGGGISPVQSIASRDAEHTAATAIEGRDESARVERSDIDKRHQISRDRRREAASTGPMLARTDPDLDHHPALVVRSAAPKVLGVSVYLIIAWLVLMYLMYRTGSVF
ncbi:unnamed protein product [Discula destructiva]